LINILCRARHITGHIGDVLLSLGTGNLSQHSKTKQQANWRKTLSWENAYNVEPKQSYKYTKDEI